MLAGKGGAAPSAVGPHCTSDCAGGPRVVSSHCTVSVCALGVGKSLPVTASEPPGATCVPSVLKRVKGMNGPYAPPTWYAAGPGSKGCSAVKTIVLPSGAALSTKTPELVNPSPAAAATASDTASSCE